ncbi:MAG TPA: pitrilysin family protein [Actinomycetota bacterium]
MIGRTEYASGLRVITERMPGVRSVTLGVWVPVGSRDEPARTAGASHFLEHLLFKGTKARSARDIAEAFDAVGGELNAFTGREQTVFYARVLDKDLPMAVDHLTDMIERSLLRSRDVEAERQVILEEIHMTEDAPDQLVHDDFARTLWGGHPLGRAILGTRETIEGMGRDQIRRFWKRHYVPGNLVFVAAGNVEHEALTGLIESLVETGAPVSGRRSTVRDGGTPPRPSGSWEVRRRRTEQAHIAYGTAGLARRDPRRFAFGVVNNALGEGMSSRLFQEVREKRGLAYSVYSYHAMYAETGLFCVYAGTTPVRATEVLRVIRGQIEDLAEKGLGPDELERAKGHMKGGLVLSQEDTSSRMNRLGKSEVAHGEILTVDEVIERIDTVTAEDARDVAADVLGREPSLAVIGPLGKDALREVLT